MSKLIKYPVILVFVLLLGFNSAYCDNKTAIQQKRAVTKQKIQRLKLLEKIETNKLYKNQQKLEQTKRDLYDNRQQYNSAETRLNALQNELGSVMYSYNALQADAAHRIRQIYKHQRRSYIEFLLSSNDFNTMLDRLYFENLVTKSDKYKLTQIKQKARRIAVLKAEIEREKQYLASSINDINHQQKYIQKAINQNEALIHRLKTDRRAFEKSERELARQSEAISSMIVRTVDKKETVNVTARFIRPLAGPVTSPFGWRIHPIFKSRTFHSGMDIGARMGTPIKASNSGKVIYSGWYGGYGKVVIVDHGKYNGNSITTLYAHMSNYAVSAGAYVKQGQVVGYVGQTGYATGPHCHFEVRINGKVQNPVNYIR